MARSAGRHRPGGPGSPPCVTRGVFPLLLQRAAATPGARRTRDVVYAALREAGLPEGDAAQLERLALHRRPGFAASEAGGRFAALSPEQLDADFARLQDVVAGAVLGALAATTP